MKRTHALVLALCLLPVPVFAQLSPPSGPVAPTMKPLDQVEPRIPISAATTPGDANSVYRISQPGSYYLTGDVAGEAGKSGVEIVAPDVTLDLMGFTLRGVPNSLSGVVVDSQSVVNFSVRNGKAVSWGVSGFDLVLNQSNVGGLIEDLQAVGNGSVGLVAPDRSIIRRVSARNNGASGIASGVRSVVELCIAENNAITGIGAGFASVVRSCTASRNGGAGIGTANACHIVDCSSIENDGDGIRVSNNCLVRGNLCDGNGFFSSDGAGLLVTGTGCRIEDNNLTRNDRGLDVDAAGNFIVRNSASGNTIAYSLTGTQTIGPMVSASGTIQSTSPWANFQF